MKYIFLLLALLILYSCSENATNSEESDTVIDIDGNVYQTVKIGNQWWMAENLKFTHYRNGEAIEHSAEENELDWIDLTEGAWCAYKYDVVNFITYGLLYNWHAVNDIRNIAPAGWHVPTDEEWKELEMFLGMSRSEADGIATQRGLDQADKLRAESGWAFEANGTNISGFSALPGGFRMEYIFIDKPFSGLWWTNTEVLSDSAWFRVISEGVGRGFIDKQKGFSVRCVKD